MLETLSPRPTLCVDETGVGIGVVQILRRSRLPATIKGIYITSGHEVKDRPTGGYNVPKKELIAAGQSALQGKRLQISPKLAEAKMLARELQNFKVKITLQATETMEAAWREGSHGDLVFAVCMAVWYGENAGRRLTADMFVM